ncbi:MAG: hypothetical protein K6E20_07015 [Acholeplasmatales bacterium]|nr:hypothetical protein [Acholeplasmatales bacterium]
MDINICKELLDPFLKEHDLYFYSVELVEEAGEKILRVIIDKRNGIDLETLGQANEYLSSKLDKYDSDMPEYLLEVSSRGAERTIDNDEELEEALDKYVHIEWEENSYDGNLIEINPDSLTLRVNLKGRFKNFKIERKDIKFIRRAVKI